MIFEAIVAILVLILGLTLLVFSSDKAVKHSISIASALGASPLVIGLILVSLGMHAYLKGLHELVRPGMYPGRSAAIRAAVRDMLKKELWSRRKI
jgi:hypothetical protein